MSYYVTSWNVNKHGKLFKKTSIKGMQVANECLKYGTTYKDNLGFSY